MITIDGSHGEGGGQIIRSSLGLAMMTGRETEIINVRAGRKKPGLQKQHLTAVRAAVKGCAAEVQGDRIGSTRIVFKPGPITPGDFHFSIGSAGSTSLVFQTILPALLVARGESTVTIEGGTHNPFAPPFDFLARCYLPIVDRMGPRVDAKLDRHGFYPAGGGRVTYRIVPSETVGPIRLVERGPILRRRAKILTAQIPEHVAQNERRAILARDGWKPSDIEILPIRNSAGPGNAVMLAAESESVVEICSAYGKRGVPAKQVARDAIREFEAYLDLDVPVGVHLADQLLLPMAIGAYQGTGGGELLTGPLSLHTQTHIELIRLLLNVEINVETDGDRNRIEVIAKV